MRSPNIFHEPLHPLDSEKQTLGYRHTNSDICAKNGLPKVCALVRADKLCVAPPMTWPKQFQKLKAAKAKSK